MKSTTVEPVTEENPALAGLVNPDYQAFWLLVGELRATGKPVTASLAGFTVEAYTEMVQACDSAGLLKLEYS